MERLTGYRVEECLRMPDYPLPMVYPEDRPTLRQALENCGVSQGSDLEFRLVHKQDPAKIRAAFKAFVEARIPADCSVEFHPHGGSPAIQLAYDLPFVAKAKAALSDEWPKPAVTIGTGGSIPVVGDFKTYLGMDALLVGFGLSAFTRQAIQIDIRLPNPVVAVSDAGVWASVIALIR